MTTAYVNSISTAVPPHDINGRFIAFADRLLDNPADRRLFQRMARLSGIEHRWSFLSPADDDEAADGEGFYRIGEFPGTGARMRRFEDQGLLLCEQALADLQRYEDLASATHLLMISCTGFIAPGIDQMLVRRLGLDPGIERTAIGFMGCAAAVNGLKLARHIVRSVPDARVLMINLELCSLHLQRDGDLESVLQGLLFGDGCAASWITARSHGVALHDFRALTLPRSADLIGWRIGDQGFEMRLSGDVPHHLSAALEAESRRNARDGILAGEATDAYSLWAVHPGGRTILDAVQRGLGLADEALVHSRSVLRDFGNMSSATLMFVLARMIAAGEEGRGVAMAFGPGLTAETFRFSIGRFATGRC